MVAVEGPSWTAWKALGSVARSAESEVDEGRSGPSTRALRPACRGPERGLRSIAGWR
jgi:hypothetical protein